MKGFFLGAMFITLLLFLGCVQTDAEVARAVVSNFPEVKQILDENPGSQVLAVYMSREAVQIASRELREKCGNDFAVKNYWYVTLTNKGRKAEAYVNENLTELDCLILPKGGLTVIEHECLIHSDCDDNKVSTRDECSGSPRTCSNTEITECGPLEGYCPPGCIYSTDRDCQAIDECLSDVDCGDSNRLTKDTCGGTPKVCSYSLKTCEELGEHLCEESETCLAKILPVSETGICCDESCVKTKSCEGVKCEEGYKCVNGECYQMTCAERELELCSSAEICDNEYFVDSLGIRCCTGECKEPCTGDANCGLDRVCSDGFCVFASCVDAGGKTCTSEEKCVGEIVKAADTDYCCTDCRAKTCEERSGKICQVSDFEFCPKPETQTFDTNYCCLDECDVNACLSTPCALNEKCDYTTCVPLSCKERGGVNCTTGTCDGDIAVTSDTISCCIGTCS